MLVQGPDKTRDELFFDIARDKAHIGQLLEQIRRHLGVTARDDNGRPGVSPGRPPDELPGLKVRPCRHRAGVDDKDIGFGIEADHGVTQLLQSIRHGRRFALVHFAAQRCHGNSSSGRFSRHASIPALIVPGDTSRRPPDRCMRMGVGSCFGTFLEICNLDRGVCFVKAQ